MTDTKVKLTKDISTEEVYPDARSTLWVKRQKSGWTSSKRRDFFSI